jgi:hypothetical protein
MHEQSNKDVQRDAIQSRLSKILLKNYGNFIDGMKQIQARVTGVTMTCMHLLTSRGLCVCVCVCGGGGGNPGLGQGKNPGPKPV